MLYQLSYTPAMARSLGQSAPIDNSCCLKRQTGMVWSMDNHRSNGLACMHQVETVIYAVKAQRVGNHRIDFDPAFHIPVDDSGDIGAPAGAAESCAFPHPASDQLEWAGRNFCTGWRNPDDYRLTPGRDGHSRVGPA